MSDNETTSPFILPLDAFIRSVGINRTTPHALFLGAGASTNSGIPSAEMCIWEWKRSIFLTNHPGLEKQFSELSLVSIRQRIQKWLDEQGIYPEEGYADEYGVYIEKCYPISQDRKQYFQEKVRNAQPHIGYRLLGLLAKAGLVQSVWTTNFDGLVARASTEHSVIPIEVGIDTQNRLSKAVRSGELLCVSLHGDYRYDPLKNTPSEIQVQEQAMLQGLKDHVQHSPLIIIGYSGRDDSIMAALHDIYSQKGSGALYWCGFDTNEVAPPVANLLATARGSGRIAHYVVSHGFDDVMIRLSQHCLEDGLSQFANNLIAERASRTAARRERFAIEDVPTVGIIKSNAFEVECPSEVLQFEIEQWPPQHTWAWLRELTAGKDIVAVPFHSKVLAFGRIDEIKQVFAGHLRGRIERVPVDDRDLRYEDGQVAALMRMALVRSMAMLGNLSTDGKEELWDNNPKDTFAIADQNCLVHESVHVSLRFIGTTMYVVLKPSVVGMTRTGERISKEIEAQLRLSVLSAQYNKKFNRALNGWRTALLPKTGGRYEYPPNCGSGFCFRIKATPAFAKIGSHKKRAIPSIDAKMAVHLKHSGFELDEPSLTFSRKQGTGFTTDPHPIRGILNNRPYDYALTQQHLVDDISLGVICPSVDSQRFEQVLHRIRQTHVPESTERDYLLDYPGFERAYGLPIVLPSPNTSSWVTCPEPHPELDSKAGCLELARSLTHCINELRAASNPNVIIVLVPTRWQKWNKFEAEDEKFDLHDHVKAYCVRRGLASQFLREEKLATAQQCRFWWWLSLALYAKSMRTPWVLGSLDERSAFVGLGFSVDTKAERGRHVVLGCSHIYSAQGEGLQYRLSKVEDPILRRGNPFMSHEDARRSGETIRQLFHEARERLPERIVIHKQTPFLRQEREGLLEGLAGVAQVEMLEINIDSSLRYVASIPKEDGHFDDDNYPVRRGTTVKLDDFTALVWVHGATSAVNPRLNYYQGKRRIPAPLVVRRHMGESSLNSIASEILGLSKMDWNSFDLYTKLPATVHSSGKIAKIGSLLERFGNMSYDYRLFI